MRRDPSFRTKRDPNGASLGRAVCISTHLVPGLVLVPKHDTQSGLWEHPRADLQPMRRGVFNFCGRRREINPPPTCRYF